MIHGVKEFVITQNQSHLWLVSTLFDKGVAF